MSVDAILYLPGNVQADKVMLVIGKLIGLPAHRVDVEENPPGYIEVPGASARHAKGAFNMVMMDFAMTDKGPAFKWSGDDSFDLIFHFESNHGTDRLMVGRSDAFHIAIFKGLADFFGGDLCYSDAGGFKDIGYKVRHMSDGQNQPDDGPEFWHLQDRIFKLRALREIDFVAANEHANYRED